MLEMSILASKNIKIIGAVLYGCAMNGGLAGLREDCEAHCRICGGAWVWEWMDELFYTVRRPALRFAS